MVDDGRREAAASRAYESPSKSNLPSFVDRAPRAAFIVFLVISAVSFILAIRWGADRSFFYDDWDFLAARDAGSFDSLMRPHNEHWTTLPILAYRAVWSLFGMHTYLPYQLLSISTHLAAAGLLRAVMRRSDVAPWIATAAAGLFAVFGAGAQNILFAFQITFVGSLAFGLVQLLLADHDGPIGWRDFLAVAAGLASLMCSGMGVAMVFSVGLSVLLKRGWRPALLQTMPLALVYLAWWLTYGQDALQIYRSTPRKILTFVVSGVIGTFDALGQVPGVGLLLAVVILGGLVSTWQSSRWNGLHYRFGVPVALALGSLVLLSITGYGRALFGAEAARASRYLDLVAAMWLLLIAVAATVVSRRWWVASVVVILLLLIGAVGNTKVLSEYEHKVVNNRAFVSLVEALAHSDLLEEVPDDVRPFPEYAREMSTGWLVEGARSGRIPEPGTVSKATSETLRFRLSFAQGAEEAVGESCEELTTPIDRDLEVGDSLIILGGTLRIADRDAEASYPRVIDFAIDYKQQLGNRINVLAPVKVRLTAPPSAPQTRICR